MITSKNPVKNPNAPEKSGKEQIRWEKLIQTSTENAIRQIYEVFGGQRPQNPDVSNIKLIYREIFDALVTLIRNHKVGLDYLYKGVIEPVIVKNEETVIQDTNAFFNELINAVAIRFSVTSPLPLDTTKEVVFFSGAVKFLNSFRPTITNYTLIGTSTVVSLKNNAHLCLVDDHSKVKELDEFEVIALKDTVQVVVGEIPKKYWQSYSLDHFMELSKKYAKK